MKKLLAAIALASLLLSSCISLRPVELKRVENLSIVGGNDSLKLTISLAFFNPNRFGCTITDITSEGAIRNRPLFQTGISKNIRAKSKSDFTIPVTAYVMNKDLGKLLSVGISLLVNDETVPMNINGKLKIKKWFLYRSFQFNSNQTIDKAQLRKLF